MLLMTLYPLSYYRVVITLYPLPFTLYPLPFTLYPLPFTILQGGASPVADAWGRPS